MRKRLFNRIKAGKTHVRAGMHLDNGLRRYRKAQMLAQAYKKAGGDAIRINGTQKVAKKS